MGRASIAAVRVGIDLRPLDDDAREAIRGLAPGVPVMVEIRQSRNVNQHRLYWGLIGKVHKNLPDDKALLFPKKENLSDAIKVAVGHYEERYYFETVDGEVQAKPYAVAKSIAFDAMSQVDFDEFLRDAINAICKFVLVDMKAEDLLAELESILY